MTVPATPTRYRAVIGLTMASGKRVEAGNLWPAGSAPPEWMIEQGKVEPTKKAGA